MYIFVFLYIFLKQDDKRCQHSELKTREKIFSSKQGLAGVAGGSCSCILLKFDEYCTVTLRPTEGDKHRPCSSGAYINTAFITVDKRRGCTPTFLKS